MTSRLPAMIQHAIPGNLLIAACLCAQILLPQVVLAQWQISNETDNISGAQTAVAEISNDDGYLLAIYRDAQGTVHARFSLNDQLIHLHDSMCPTFQVDDREMHNNSLNGPACQLDPRLSEHDLGAIEDNQLVSKPIYEMMNGTTIHYRFRLQSGSYDKTSFSLAGSKSALKRILGTELEVLPR